MKFLSKLFLLINLLILIKSVYCQVPVINDNEKIVEDKIENVAENINYDYDFNDLTENLMYFIENPINLNDPKKDDLQKLSLLTDIQINNLLNYIENYGEILSIYELQMINGFNDYIISRLLPFVYIGEVKKSEIYNIFDMLQNGRKSLLLYYQAILEEQKGYSTISESELLKNPNQRYLGSPYRFFTKFKYNYKNYLQYGFTADKDAGEEFFKGSQNNGFDFYSAHLFLRNNTWLKSLVVGDFHAQFGQGLTLWTGLSYSKTYDPISIKKYPQGIKPYTSTNEYGFLRGLGTTLRYKKLEFSLVASRKLLDANIGGTDTINNDIYYVTSLLETGYHRTYNELSDKNAIAENIFGGNISFNEKQYQIGITAYKSNYSSPIIKKTEPYNQFDFTGKDNTNLGANFNLLLLPFNFFGEISLSENLKKAYLIGLQGNIENRMTIGILFRKYDVGFQNIRNAAFGENTKNSNEQGIYIGTEYFLAKKWTISAYCDLFEFPWLRYNDDSPSVGSDYLIKIDYRYNRKLNFYFQFREKNKFQNNSETIYTKQHEETIRRNFRININLIATDELSFNSRFEWCVFTKGNYYNNNGFLIYQDMSYKFRFYPVKFSARYALFDTDSYDERIYAYENDVLYAFSIPSYYYKGSKVYFLIKCDVNKNIDLWFRFSQTYYLNKNKISSGLDEINGNTKSEIKTQLIIKF
jgi:hypothetical protein